MRDLVLADCPEGTIPGSDHLHLKCIVFSQRRQDNSLDTETKFSLFGAYDGLGKDFSYLRLTVSACEDSQLKESLNDPDALCFPRTGTDFYLDSIRL